MSVFWNCLQLHNTSYNLSIMDPPSNPHNWASYGPNLYPFYLSIDLPRMNMIRSFSWVMAEGDHDPSRDKYLEFLIGGTPVDMTKGRVERYTISIEGGDGPQSLNSLDLKHPFEYRFDFPVVNAVAYKSMLATRTIGDTVYINDLTNSSLKSKFKFPEPSKQNNNRTLAWNISGDTVLTTSDSKNIYLYDTFLEKAKLFEANYNKDITDAIWLNNKFFATASYGGRIYVWSINENKPIFGFADPKGSSYLEPTCLALVKKGAEIQDVTLLSATGSTITLWDRSRKSRVIYQGRQNSRVTKVNYTGAVTEDTLFAYSNESGQVVTHKRNEKKSIYHNLDFGVCDFDCKNSFYGVVCEKRRFVVWTPRRPRRKPLKRISEKEQKEQKGTD